ncbi:hypothetical protein TCAL_10642, partial [Tigriopus californicus]|eukprot:TCALIF_10642-PA protein Name:"Similar to Calmodulin (Suberites domuncula)" AED:0.12 eAED:0.12 QI:195/0.66/0.5/1/0.66/0.5/4/0/198
MADKISSEDIARLMEAFHLQDVDQDGLISTKQLGEVLHTLGQNPTEAELQDLAYAMDTNESGTIDLPEFLHMMAIKMAEVNMEEEILEAFKIFDKDGNGLISSREEFPINVIKANRFQFQSQKLHNQILPSVDHIETPKTLLNRELKHVMANLGECLSEDEVEAMIKEADSDGDGSINYAEFFVMISKSFEHEGGKFS